MPATKGRNETYSDSVELLIQNHPVFKRQGWFGRKIQKWFGIEHFNKELKMRQELRKHAVTHAEITLLDSWMLMDKATIEMIQLDKKNQTLVEEFASAKADFKKAKSRGSAKKIISLYEAHYKNRSSYAKAVHTKAQAQQRHFDMKEEIAKNDKSQGQDVILSMVMDMLSRDPKFSNTQSAIVRATARRYIPKLGSKMLMTEGLFKAAAKMRSELTQLKSAIGKAERRV
jgi:uncharacterized glyoxalase superfamily protein PhnB